MTIRTYLFLILMSSLASSGFPQDALSVSPDGDVGIGTTAPSEKLDVDGNIKASGRIMDAMGFVMPVGSIMPYGGTTPEIVRRWHPAGTLGIHWSRCRMINISHALIQ
jgi:hypothetical protein